VCVHMCVFSLFFSFCDELDYIEYYFVRYNTIYKQKRTKYCIKLTCVGARVGALDGPTVGARVGTFVGARVGTRVGSVVFKLNLNIDKIR
jgi:hypothetical protein